MRKIGKNKTGVFHSYDGYLFDAVADDGRKTTTEILGIPIYDEDDDEMEMSEEILIVPCTCCRQPVKLRFNADGDIIAVTCNHCQSMPPAT